MALRIATAASNASTRSARYRSRRARCRLVDEWRGSDTEARDIISARPSLQDSRLGAEGGGEFDVLEQIRRRRSMYIGTGPASATERLTRLLIEDAAEHGSTVAVERVGRLTVVHGSPDWLPPEGEAAFNLLRRPLIFLSALGTRVATRAHGSKLTIVRGELTQDEVAQIRTMLLEGSDRVVAFEVDDDE